MAPLTLAAECSVPARSLKLRLSWSEKPRSVGRFGRPRPLRLRSLLPLPTTLSNLLHLCQMVQIMPSEHAHKMRHRLFPALRVHAVVIPKILGQPLEHAQI